jgi:hypothetical protein
MKMCPLCGGPIRKGQVRVLIRAFVRVTDAYNQPMYEQMVLEDGSSSKEAHYGCVLRRCPELIGVTWGEPREV